MLCGVNIPPARAESTQLEEGYTHFGRYKAYSRQVLILGMYEQYDVSVGD
jgi:hypothetical protein